ncbi:DUF3244 domain-containing protein [Alistipes sp.]|jgi:hypothetical protein|uniref:DUF3244 domain-containing protein n=1 Tax=Alistipes sp. TaxID=1872444 RepID=UPI0011C8A72F
MKKIFLLLVLLVFTFPIKSQVFTRVSVKQIQITDVINNEKHFKPRSVKPVEAYINYDFEEIEVNFNDDLEKVVVVIQDQTGQEVCSYCCDTNSEPVVSLPLPISEGAYTLRVMGETYEGEGVFDL